MLVIRIHNKSQSLRLEHRAGALTLGRQETSGPDRIVIDDPFVSSDHLHFQELPQGRLYAECLCETKPAFMDGGEAIPPGEFRVLSLPAGLQIGDTRIDVACESETSADNSLAASTLPSPFGRRIETPRLDQLGASPDPATLTRWLENLQGVLHAAVGSNALFAAAADAVVQRIGLDRGLVLLRQGNDWIIGAASGVSGPSDAYNRTVVQDVLARKETVQTGQAASITDTLPATLPAPVVAAPIFDVRGGVRGVVYGSREVRGLATITPLEAQVVQLLASIVSTSLNRVHREVEAAEARTRLEQFASPELAQKLHGSPDLLACVEREITALFCDVCGFAGIAERLDTAITYMLLRDVMNRLTDCVFHHEGVIVDYYGDGLCAMWNAPLRQPDHADRACCAAQDMVRTLPDLSRKWRSAVGEPFRLGVGIHTGVALIGNAGSRRRVKYGPRGHCVNLASRVEGVTRQLEVPIVLTSATRQLLQSPFGLRRLCRAGLKGVEETVELYELNVAESPAWSRLRVAYEEALGHYEAGRAAKASIGVQKICNDPKLPRDGPSLALQERIKALARERPADFDGVWRFDSK
jgi:adenylate cyclase